MPNEIINQVYELKRGKEDTLYQVNPVLMPSEPIIVFCNSGLTKIRIGDGFNDYRNLPFINDSIIEDNTLELISKINKTTVYLYDLSPGVYSFDKSVSNTFQLYTTEELTQTISSDYLMIVTGENGTFNPTTNFVKGLFLFKIDGNCCIYDIISGNSYFRGIKTGNSWRFIGEYSEVDFYIPSNKGSDDESDTINNIANDRNTLQLVNNLKTLFDKKLNLKEDLQNKSKEIDEKSNDLTYPTTKAVQELLSITQTDYEESDINNPRYLINKPFYKTETEKTFDYTEIPCPKPDLFFDEVTGFAILDYTLPLNIGDNITYKLTAEVDGVTEEAISPEDFVVVDGSVFTGIKDSLTFAPASSPDEVIEYYVSGATRVELDEESELGFRFIGKVDDEGNPIIDEESGLMVADENSSMLLTFYDETGTQFVNPKITMYGLESTVTETEVIFNTDYVDGLQSDYNESDSTKPGYIKNRLVYESQESFSYTRLGYDENAIIINGSSHDFQVRNSKLGLESPSDSLYTIMVVSINSETGEVLQSESFRAHTRELTSDKSISSNLVVPAGATELSVNTYGSYHTPFAYDGVVYDESTGTLSLGEGSIHWVSEEDVGEYRIGGLPSEELVAHKLPSRLVSCSTNFNRSSLSPQSGKTIQGAILSAIPTVPSTLSDGHVEVTVTDDEDSVTGKKVSIYSTGIGNNNQLRTTSRDTIVNAVNEVYNKTAENNNKITQNTTAISNVNRRVDTHTDQISKLQEGLSKNSADISKVAKDLKGTANAVLNTVKGNQLEISDISPVTHNLQTNVDISHKNLIKFPYSGVENTNNYIRATVESDGTVLMTKWRSGAPSPITKSYCIIGDDKTIKEDAIILQDGKKYVISLNYGKETPDSKLNLFIVGECKITLQDGTIVNNGQNHNSAFIQDGSYAIVKKISSMPGRLYDITVMYNCSGITEVLDSVEVRVQVEEGETPTSFERRIAYSDITVESKVGDEVVQSIVPDNSGVVSGLISQYPVTSLSTNLPDNVEISCTYHQDVNVALSNLKNEMLGSMDEVIASIGGAQ